MKNLSRRLYNSSLTLAISFGFYALIFAFTLSCDTEEGMGLPTDSATEELSPADTTETHATEVVSYVEDITN